MIKASIKRIKRNLISNEHSDQSIPIFFVGDLGDLGKYLSKEDYKYLTALKFKGICGECIILPKSDGNIGKVIFGIRSKGKFKPKFLFTSY